MSVILLLIVLCEYTGFYSGRYLGAGGEVLYRLLYAQPCDGQRGDHAKSLFKVKDVEKKSK